MIRAEDTIERMNYVHQTRGTERVGDQNEDVRCDLLAVTVGLLVGFVLFELAAIVLSGHAAKAGTGRILVRLALVCGGITLMVVVLRRGSRQP